ELIRERTDLAARLVELGRLDFILALIAWLRSWRKLRRVRGPLAAAHGWPAVHPIERIHQHRALGEADLSREIRIIAVDRVIEEPVLAREVGEYRVVARADPAVAVHADHGRAADAPGQQ